MDKSWMHIHDRLRDCDYAKGVKEFMDLARKHADIDNRIRCPCRKCKNVYYETVDIVEDHLFISGIDLSYTKWVLHGEEYGSGKSGIGCTVHEETNVDSNVDETHEFLHDIGGGRFFGSEFRESSTGMDPPLSDCDPGYFEKLWDDAHSQLYPGCDTFSKLSFIVKLLHLKTINNWSVKSFDDVLQMFKQVLRPVGDSLPESHYEAKQLTKHLGFGYERIHACKNDCILFWNEHKDAHECPTCRESRWKVNDDKKQIPHKVLRYFPLKPRLQRLFKSKKTASEMRWHKEKQVEDEKVLMHPSDSEVWKEFDKEHEWFAREPRNVRLGLATDGFNPFGNMSTMYSMWPVVLMPYNLPPWMCMKDPYFMMALLIPGPKAPGNDIDVYLRPLVDELKELWENGVKTYDASTSSTFQLHAAVLWTINDFPACGNLSGWSTKGKLACPNCNEHTASIWLKNGQKMCFMGHRRYLSSDHSWRRNKTMFDGTEEYRMPPIELSGNDILMQLTRVRDIQFGKGLQSRKRKRTEVELNWTKKSIFFELSYWSTLKLRHNLDVMHIEKNICESVLGTLMDIEGKTKDTVKARKDMFEMGVKKELHLQQKGLGTYMKHAWYTFTKDEKRKVCDWLLKVKFPDGYASKISRCVNIKDCKISGMKSHDCHVFLQRLLPVVIRGYLRKDVIVALTELSFMFRDLCSRTLKVDVLRQMDKDVGVLLSKLERIFPPAFFDVMLHLLVHLPREALLAGPVQYRWMYPIERFLGKLKRYVKNKAHVEGSIAEGYIAEECLTFCSMYFNDVETRFNRPERNIDVGDKRIGDMSVFSHNVRHLGAKRGYDLIGTELEKVHWYVLNNCTEIERYRIEHMDLLRRQYTSNVYCKHQEDFPKWFKHRIQNLRITNPSQVSDELYALASGPDQRCEQYWGCIVNGIRFHTREHEKSLTTQNSGVTVQGDSVTGELVYYGVIQDIFGLKYTGQFFAYIFKCDWWDIGNRKNGIQIDDHFTSVNTSRIKYKDDPFVLAYQCQQVLYLADTQRGGAWQVIQKIMPRKIYDVPEVVNDSMVEESDDNNEVYRENEPSGANVRVEDENLSPLSRDAVGYIYAHLPPIEPIRKRSCDTHTEDAFIKKLQLPPRLMDGPMVIVIGLWRRSGTRA